MANYSPTVDVDITINAVNLTQEGFGTPIFVCAHQRTDDRVISIQAPKELVTDYGFEETDNAYLAATQFFKNSPSVNFVKIGRRAGTTTTSISDVDDSIPETYTINVSYLRTGVTYTGQTTHNVGTDTAEEICDALVASLLTSGGEDITNFLNVSRVGTAGASSIEISSIDEDFTFRVETLTSGNTSSTFSNTYTGDESADSVFNSLLEYDADFYFVTSEVRGSIGSGFSFCRDLSAAVQTTDRLYAISSGDQNDLDLESAETSLFKYLKENGRTQTITFMHHYGNSSSVSGEAFPECYYVGFNAPYDAGTVSWCNLVSALPPSAQPTNNNKPLTTSQRQRLVENDVNFVEKDAGVNIIRTGVTAGGEWIDVIRGVHWLKSDLTVSLKGLLFNQKGGSIAYTNSGIARVREVCQSSLQRAVNRGFLDSYTLSVPLISEVSNQDWMARLLRDVTFTGILTGAIHTIGVKGQVTTPAAV
jgi:hypothetical protein